jgi:hypothetical protein
MKTGFIDTISKFLINALKSKNSRRMVKYGLMGIYCNRGRIVTVGDGTTSDVIQKDVENQGNQGNQEEKSV